VHAAVERCRIESDGGAGSVGVRVLSGTHVAVTDGLVADDGLGVHVRVEAGSPLAALTITRSTLTDNRIGVYADRTGQAHLVDSTVSLNDTGPFRLNAGIVSSAGNNAVLGNFSVNLDAGTVYFPSDISA
jgi:hypothetical protein